MIKATISEQGNGFPDVGDYVTGNDGEVYEVLSLGPRIETRGPGAGNCIPGCELQLADWTDDITDDNEPTCSAVLDEPRDRDDDLACEGDYHRDRMRDDDLTEGRD